MNEMKLPPTPKMEEILKVQKSIKWFFYLAYVFNAIFAAFTLATAITSLMIFDNPKMHSSLGLAIIVLFLSIPISVPIFVSKMRMNYKYGNKRNIYLYGFMPILYMVIVSILIGFLEYFAPMFI